MMLPRVILHNAVSLDGRIGGFPVDLQQYYGLAASFGEDATLAGADTFLSAEDEAPPEDESAFLLPRIDPGDSRPILVIPDSRGRIRTWHYLRALPYWRDFVALCSRRTPPEFLQYLEKRHIHCIIAGKHIPGGGNSPAGQPDREGGGNFPAAGAGGAIGWRCGEAAL
jgi:2,5-diamino-6-(ribosylamino)-4(3H)-pyrimidinone 5'-phosphate reductase